MALACVNNDMGECPCTSSTHLRYSGHQSVPTKTVCFASKHCCHYSEVSIHRNDHTCDMFSARLQLAKTHLISFLY